MSWDNSEPFIHHSDELEQLSNAIKSGTLGATDLFQYAKLADREIQTVIFRIIWDDENPDIKNRKKAEFVLTYLIDSLNEGLVNDHRMGRYEAAQFLMWRFIQLWRRRDDGRSKDDLESVRLALGELLKNSNAVVHEVVTLSILEHLFSDKRVANFFSEWKEDDSLRNIYEESLKLASKF